VTELTYTPDEDVHVHTEGAIRLICATFQSHEDGLPEWVKNASDEYVRQDTPAGRRAIFVLLRSGSGQRPPSISVLDLNGMTSEVIENRFRQWADPNASTQEGVEVQGGHGNGGKCYMTMMFEDHSLIHTVKDGLGCRYGVSAGSFNFGYIPDRHNGRDFEVTDVVAELTAALAGVGVTVTALPERLQELIKEAAGFTLVSGIGAKGWGNRIPAQQTMQQLADHPQMVGTLDLCDVYVIHNGTVMAGANPIALEPVTPDAAFAEPRIIPIPVELIDPDTDMPVSTVEHGQPQGELILLTSDTRMNYRRKHRHHIRYFATSGRVGFRPVTEFSVASTYRDRIYGECRLMSLDRLKQNHRGPLANSPLSRAVEAWIAVQIQEYALEFEARSRREHDQNERNELARINEALDRWKNQFMADYMGGLWGGDDGNIPRPPRPTLPAGVPQRIEVDLAHRRSGIGVAFKPTIKFFDRDDKRIRPTPFKWVSDDTNVALVDEQLNIVSTFAAGTTEIWAETLDGRVTSNRVPLEVVRIREIEMFPPEVELPRGSRRGLEARCHLSNGEVITDVYLLWIESDPTVARVSASGSVYGHGVGVTDVLASDDHCMASQPARITVVESDGAGAGDTPGNGYPLILVSGYQEDPETGEQVELATDDPPVHQRPQDADRNIWWINSSAPFAQMYLDQERDYGYMSREWRIYHLERVLEIMVQIALANDPDGDNMDASSWLQRWGERMSQIQSGAAQALGAFISDGALPEEA